ncbi:MAG: sulfurtransferase [Atopobiaceae bacterium]|jgi:3-mercaptopyruvate sulfurtransferase SseA
MKQLRVLLATAALALALPLAACGTSQQAASDNNSSTSTVQESTTPAAEVEDVEQRTVYVSPAWADAAINGKVDGYSDVLVAQVLYDDSDLSTYNEGHIPGAIVVTDVDVEDAVGDEAQPYNILAPETLEANLLARGITKDTKVVLYGEDPSGVARVAYGMIYAGVEDVKIVDGGLDAWKAAGYSTETTTNNPTAATDFGTQVPAHPEYYTTMADAAEKLESDDTFKLVSIRSEGEWLGETSGYGYIDRAGEPDGAVWGKGCDTAFDVNGLVHEDGTIMTLDEIKASTWSDVDFTLDDHLAFYCGTGWRASVPFLILYQNGYDNISVYDGGWYEWQMHGENKVQVGDPSSADCVHTTVSELPTDKAAQA